MDLGRLALEVSWALALSAEVWTRHMDAVAVLVHRHPFRKAEVSNDTVVDMYIGQEHLYSDI